MVLDYKDYPLPVAFALDDQESYTFDAFDLWTDETTVNRDDKAQSAISVTLNLDPPNFDAGVSGFTSGATGFFGLFQYGSVVWNNPAPFVLGDRTFSVSLNDANFNFGTLGLNEGEMHGATIKATFTQISSEEEPAGGGTVLPITSVDVPDGGGTALLLGLAVTGIGLVARRRFSVAVR